MITEKINFDRIKNVINEYKDEIIENGNSLMLTESELNQIGMDTTKIERANVNRIKI